MRTAELIALAPAPARSLSLPSLQLARARLSNSYGPSNLKIGAGGASIVCYVACLDVARRIIRSPDGPSIAAAVVFGELAFYRVHHLKESKQGSAGLTCADPLRRLYDFGLGCHHEEPGCL